MQHRTIGILILLGWLTVVGFHVRREYFRPAGERLALGARSLAPGTHFFSVTMNGRAIGLATSAFDTLSDGFVLDDNLVIDVPALDTVARAVAVTRVELDDSLTLRNFAFRLESAVGRFAATGERTSAGDLAVSIDGGAAQERIEFESGALLDAVVPLRMAAAGVLESGREVGVRVLDPSTLSMRDATVRITATDTLIVPDSVGVANGRFVATGMDTIPVWRVEQEFGGVRLETWVDEDGMTVRAESPLGFTIERTAYELAQQAWNDARLDPTLASGYGVLIEGTAVASNVPLTGVEQRASLRVRLRGVDLAGFDLDGGRQTLRGDTLEVRREVLPATAATWLLPWSGGGEPAAELASTPLIQAGDPRIRAAAERVLDGTRDPYEAARRLNDFVHATLRKEITPSVPSAVQVLEAGQGDCNEHTVLYVALARAVGLPARTAVGLVHINGRFYYHAWPEVWLGDEWVALDPTLGQVPADASHLRFLVGGLARQIELVRLIGRLHVDVLS